MLGMSFQQVDLDYHGDGWRDRMTNSGALMKSYLCTYYYDRTVTQPSSSSLVAPILLQHTLPANNMAVPYRE